MTDLVQTYPTVVILAMDQMSLYFQATLTRVWAVRGQTPVIRVSPQRDQVHFYGALDVRHGRDIAVLAPEQTTEVTADFVRLLLMLFSTQPILLLLDRAPWHHGPALDEVLCSGEWAKAGAVPARNLPAIGRDPKDALTILGHLPRVGTGHAVRCAMEALTGFDGDVITPELVRANRAAIRRHFPGDGVLTAVGRIVPLPQYHNGDRERHTPAHQRLSSEERQGHNLVFLLFTEPGAPSASFASEWRSGRTASHLRNAAGCRRGQ